jgi:hypothetical protein
MKIEMKIILIILSILSVIGIGFLLPGIMLFALSIRNGGLQDDFNTTIASWLCIIGFAVCVGFIGVIVAILSLKMSTEK